MKGWADAMRIFYKAFVVAFISVFVAASAAGAQKLVVATHINAPEIVQEQIALMKRFEEKYPGVEIDVWFTPWGEYHDRLLTMHLAGNAPDVATIGRFEFASFIEAGLIQPLDRFVDADPELDLSRDAIPGVLASGYYKGTLYGFPVYNGPALLFYNPNLFAERGVAEPVEYIAENRWNRESFLEVAQKLTADTSGDGVPDIVGYWGFSEWQPMWVPFIRHAGGDVVTRDGRSGLNSEAAIEALEWLNDLNVVHGVTAYPGHGGSWENGDIAMHVRWQAEGLIEKSVFPAVDPEPALMPAGPSGYAHIVGGVPVTVSSTTEHPQLAYQYAKWLAMESGLWKVRGGPPLSREEVQGPEYRSTLSVFRHPEMFELALALGDARPEPQFGFVEHQEMTRILRDVLINPIRQGLVSVRAAVDEAHRLLNQLLEGAQ